MRSILEQSGGAVSVLTIADVADAAPIARALVRGGLPVIEVTLRTSDALEAIRIIRGEVEGAVVGAGTVRSPADLERAAAAGATFAVSPGMPSVLRAAAHDSPIPYLPAIATTSELMAGLDVGFSIFKLFPAAAVGGVNWLRSVAGPFPDACFCPTGGIDLSSASDYLALPNVLSVGGSWTVPSDCVEAKSYARISELARHTRNALRQTP